MNEKINVDNTDFMKKYQKSESIMADIQNIIEESQKEAYRVVNTILTQRNWLIGYRISEEEMKGENRAEYGASIIKKLSAELTKKYGKGFTKSNLYSFYSFYKAYPDIFQTVSGKSSLSLSWSHYAILSRVLDKTARTWYEEEAVRGTVSTNYICQQKKNFVRKLKHRKQCIICNNRNAKNMEILINILFAKCIQLC